VRVLPGSRKPQTSSRKAPPTAWKLEQQLFLGEDAGRVVGEDAEEGEFLAQEGDGAAGDGYLAAEGVDDQLAHLVAAVADEAAQDGADPGLQLGVREGLACV